MDAWTGCLERIQKKWDWDRDREDGWTKKLRSLARKWNRQARRLKGAGCGSVGHGEAV